jgi:hypothetical protein
MTGKAARGTRPQRGDSTLLDQSKGPDIFTRKTERPLLAAERGSKCPQWRVKCRPSSAACECASMSAYDRRTLQGRLSGTGQDGR